MVDDILLHPHESMRLAPEPRECPEWPEAGDGPGSRTYPGADRIPPMQMATMMIDRAVTEITQIRDCSRGEVIRLLASRAGVSMLAVEEATYHTSADSFRGRLFDAIDRVEAESLVYSVEHP